ncbi:hypothetical protein MKX03_021711 [Papaver bracteatum]|nr:hypothetical protein MKX03_021711 [Papaver bracteatum]
MNTYLSILLHLLLVSAALLLGASAETYTVGEIDGWNSYSNYTDWAQGKTFHLGDDLVFNYEGGQHNVIQVNATAYDKCLKEPNLGESRNGNDTVALAKVGRIWFVCGMADHCEFGQKFSIEVLP